MIALFCIADNYIIFMKLKNLTLPPCRARQDLSNVIKKPETKMGSTVVLQTLDLLDV